MATVLPEFPTEEQRVVERFFFLWAKGLNEKVIHKEIFHVCNEKCLLRKAFQPWWQTFRR
jgi:hypothetical protein